MRRVVVVVTLCLAAVALVVGFGVQYDATPAYPDTEAIDGNYGDYVGERVHLWGVVAGERDGSVVVDVGALRLTLSSPPPSSVDPGDTIQVYGELRPGGRMETQAYHVQTPADRRYMYGSSVVGVALAAGIFLRRWRVDAGRLRFLPREDD